MSEERISVCVVGCGRIGAVHIKNVLGNTRLNLKYIVDVDLKAANNWAAKAPNCKALERLDSTVLSDKEVKGVIICTPTAAHRDLILSCVRAGKAVMCEKPVSLRVNEIDECYIEAKKHGVPLLCGYQRRHDPSFSQLTESCHNGSIGKLQVVETISRDNPVPTLAYLKISGGIFHDCGSHDIDLCRWILGEDPVEVFGYASAFNPDIKALDDYDTVVLNLKFPSGAIGMINLSRKAAYGYDQRIEVLGDKGMLQAMNRLPTTVIHSTEKGISTDPYCYSFPQRYDVTYALELDHFADVLNGKVQPKLSHDDSRKVAIIADAAEHSVRTGKPVQIVY